MIQLMQHLSFAWIGLTVILAACGAQGPSNQNASGRVDPERPFPEADSTFKPSDPVAIDSPSGVAASPVESTEARKQDSVRLALAIEDSLFARVGSWRFSPLPGEEMSIDSVLRALVRQPYGPDLRYSGSIYRLSMDSMPGRYLLLAVLPKVGDGGKDGWGLSFYVLERRGSLLTPSAPYILGVGLDSSLAQIKVLSDFDGDGLPDIAFCRWSEPYPIEPEPDYEDPPGEPRAVGFRDGSWYAIDEPTTPLPACE